MIYVIGKRSNLSLSIKKRLQDVVLVSTNDIMRDDFYFDDSNENIFIFNNFQKATSLNDISMPYEYICNSITSTAIVLEKIKKTTIKKIIYSSSASVYGNNIYCKENDDLQVLSLHSSLKIANEKLIEKFCDSFGIDYTITRVFNMFGGNDNFSVISKIINCAKNGNEFTLVNNGNSIRDFIHVDDVSNVYESLIKTIGVKKLNIASGNGISIAQIVDFLKSHGVDIKTNVIFKEELKISTGCVELLSSVVDTKKFKSVYEFLKNEIVTLSLDKK